ncbi:MAG: extracellular solute-binding protein [Clostridia bacterium]|nr:extracellular solute-binding protein [Clostridia bacterium]MBR6009396.1 extracellular solute-binding protein [Clostridia bacterium]MBR6499452.1 extracellular solute-binding protein [Clostridia bacterium]
MKRILALLLVALMAVSMLSALADEPRNITLAVWWDMYYDSDDEGWEANPGATGKESDIMRYDNVKVIEDTYNVTFEFVNPTYAGTIDSLNNSILAGEPDFDIYTVELGWGVPAVMNGLACDLRDVLDPDDPLLSHEDPIMNFVDLSNGAVSLLYAKGAENQVDHVYNLAFNLQMIQEANLEDPRDLVERGEWTWDKFREYCQVLTRDIDGDGVIDVYGYGGWLGDFLPYWFMSNGTYIAATATENFSSAEVGETLKFLQDLYITDKVAYPIPEESGWDVCRWLYRDKKVAFCTTTTWILDSYKDYTEADPNLDFDMVFIPYPIGPSGNAETNSTQLANSNYWLIPSNVEDPKLVYNVLRQYVNWFQGDTELRDDPLELEWHYVTTSNKFDLQEYNFDVMMEYGSRTMVDFLQIFINDIPFRQFLDGEYTPAQLQEQYKQVVQDNLDQLFG